MSFKFTDNVQTNCFLEWFYRYLSFPCKDSQRIKSYYGLPNCLFYCGIKIHFSDVSVVLDMSGKGCRTLESLNSTLDWFQFIHMFHRSLTEKWLGTDLYECSIARLDVACDVLDDEKMTVPKLQGYVLKDKFICKANFHSCIIGNYESVIYFGSPRSDRRLRIYDKTMEQGIADSQKWVRFEFQLRDDTATSFYLNWCNTKNIMVTYSGMLHDFLRFITVPNDGVHSARKITCKWWLSFLDDVSKIKQLYLPANNYNLAHAYDIFNHQCTSTMRTLLEANGGDVTELLTMAQGAKLNKKQRSMLSELETAKQNSTVAETKDFKTMSKSGILAVKKADEDQLKYDEKIANWVSFGTGPEAAAALHTAQIMAELAKQDLEF